MDRNQWDKLVTDELTKLALSRLILEICNA